MRKLLLAMLLVFVGMTASAESVNDTLIVKVSPQMRCENCENRVKTNLSQQKGVAGIETNRANQTVTVVFDPALTNKETLKGAFPKIGYQVSEVGQGEVATCGETTCDSHNNEKTTCNGNDDCCSKK